VPRAEPEIATGQVFAESAGGDTHRPDGPRRGMTGNVDMTVADPKYRPQFTGCGDDEVADTHILDRDLAAIGEDTRSPTIAGGGADKIQSDIARAAVGAGPLRDGIADE